MTQYTDFLFTFSTLSLPGEYFYSGRSGDQHVWNTFRTLHTDALSHLQEDEFYKLKNYQVLMFYSRHAARF